MTAAHNSCIVNAWQDHNIAQWSHDILLSWHATSSAKCPPVCSPPHSLKSALHLQPPAGATGGSPAWLRGGSGVFRNKALSTFLRSTSAFAAAFLLLLPTALACAAAACAAALAAALAFLASFSASLAACRQGGAQHARAAQQGAQPHRRLPSPDTKRSFRCVTAVSEVCCLYAPQRLSCTCQLHACCPAGQPSPVCHA